MAHEHLIEPTQNRVDGAVALPHQSSATLSLEAMHALNESGIEYVIPSMPSSYPPIKADAAVQSAATHFPVGSRPRVREIAIIATKGESVPPLRPGLMCWAIRFAIADPEGHPRDFFAFVDVTSGAPLGGLQLP